MARDRPSPYGEVPFFPRSAEDRFWNIDDAYFANPESINQRIKVPWVIRTRNKSERHISEHQLELPEGVS